MTTHHDINARAQLSDRLALMRVLASAPPLSPRVTLHTSKSEVATMQCRTVPDSCQLIERSTRIDNRSANLHDERRRSQV